MKFDACRGKGEAALNLEYQLVCENHNIDYTFSEVSDSLVCEL